MLRLPLKMLVVIAVLAIGVQQAGAFGHRWGGCRWGGCGYAGWGYCGYGGCGYGGCGYTAGWGYGPGWYGGGWGYGGYWAGTGPAYPYRVANRQAPTKVAGDSVVLSVSVPADAKVFVNDHATTSTGAQRSYVSRDLKPGSDYGFKVRAEFVRNGQTVSAEKQLRLTAGQTGAVDFTADEPVQTASGSEPARH